MTPDQIAEAAADCGFHPNGHTIQTETSLLLCGTAQDRPALAKAPTDARPFWQQRAQFEIHAYEDLSSAMVSPTLSVRLPALLGSRHDVPLLIVERLNGSPCTNARYPKSPPDPALIHSALTTLDELHHCRFPGRWTDETNYPHHLQSLNLINKTDIEIYARLHTWATRRLSAQLHHGDAHLGNFLRLDDGLAVIDLEFLALRLPHYDTAAMWVLFGDHRSARSVLAEYTSEIPEEQAAFWLAAALYTTREIVSHRRSCNTHERRRRLPRLVTDLSVCLSTLRSLVPRVPRGTNPRCL
ncbi:MAG: hypothetical protein QG608_3318 [Actinomycetota bacterium]|nr:hypothetical protein [Actinomycetota bacterium]